MKAQKQAPTRKTKNALDRRQNNKNVKVVSASPLRSDCCPNCCADQCHKDNVRSSAVGMCDHVAPALLRYLLPRLQGFELKTLLLAMLHLLGPRPLKKKRFI